MKRLCGSEAPGPPKNQRRAISAFPQPGEREGRAVAFDSPPGSPPPPSPPPQPVKEKRKCSAFQRIDEPPGRKIEFSDSSPEPPAREEQAAGAAATGTGEAEAAPELCEECYQAQCVCTRVGPDGQLDGSLIYPERTG